MFTISQRVTVVPPGSPSIPRLSLAPARAGQAVLDGGWWPRSWDPVAELPGLVLALTVRYGPIRQVMLNGAAWDGRFHRLAVGADVVRIGWFATLDPALLIATTDRGDQLDLLVVAPHTAEAAAKRAMTTAADPTNTTRAPDINTVNTVNTVNTAPQPTAAGNGLDPDAAWDNEGGHLADARAHRPVNSGKRSTP